MPIDRIALVVGVNYYQHSSLNGCVNDAQEVGFLLEKNDDTEYSKNFDVKYLLATDSCSRITRGKLKDEIEWLFGTSADTALLYFSGHGYIESSGGYIVTSECERGDDGLSLKELVDYANSSKIRNRIIILDSCFSGAAGDFANGSNHAAIADGVTILTASKRDEPSLEIGSHGVFTDLLIDALSGGAANLLGDITPGSIYAHIDQSLGAWDQRPVFKTNTESFISLRKVAPSISISDLRRISEFFPNKNYIFELNPSFEPRDEARTAEMTKSDPSNNEIFAILQKYNRLNLLVPIGAEHMWNAAMESKSCKLTRLGEHYRRMSEKGAF